MIISMEKLVYQMFILGCENPLEALSKGLGGVIFFTKDIKFILLSAFDIAFI